MKSIILFLCFIILSLTSLKAQNQTEDSKKSSIGISSTFIGKGNIISFQQLAGAPGYTGDNYYTLALNYLYRINRTFQLETGIEYGKYRFVVSPNVPPDADDSPYPIDTYLLSIPLTVRINFERFFFFNTGFTFDFDINDQYTYINQGGIGILMGLGFNYELKSGIAFFINPYLQLHHLIDFEKGNNAQKLTKAGIRIGCSYNF